MLIVIPVILILGISIILSLISIKADLKKQEHAKEISKHLSKGRVIYYAKEKE